MKATIMIIRRNMKMFLCDKSAVFFSLLAAIIVIILNIVFLGNANVEYLIEESGANIGQAKVLVVTWLVAGILIVNTITVSLSLLGLMIQDKEKNVFSAFLISPIKRINLVLAYIITAFLASVMVNMFIVVLLFVFLYSRGISFDIITVSKIIGVIILNSFSSSAFMFLLISCIKSSAQFQGLNILISTLSGFVTGIYVVLGDLPDGFQNIMKFVPIMQSAAMMRKLCTNSMINEIFANKSLSAIENYKQYMGIILMHNGNEINYISEIVLNIIISVIFIIIATIILKKKENSDR